MNANAIISLVLVAVGVGLIVLGAIMTLREWRRVNSGEIEARGDAFDKSITALAKLLEALKDYPTGQRLIVLGIVILIIAGLFGGISAL